jgi:hypothetical protein
MSDKQNIIQNQSGLLGSSYASASSAVEDKERESAVANCDQENGDMLANNAGIESQPPDLRSSGNTSERSAPPVSSQRGEQRRRKDKGHLHATRHGALTRYPLEALGRLGEDVRSLRRMERRFRLTLKPVGEIAALVFDRFFSSYLRCLLGARIEALTLVPTASVSEPQVLPTLRERELPTLILPEENDCKAIIAALPPDVFRELVLVQRYDRHFSREMFRALAMLLVLRDGGEGGLEQCIAQIVGLKKDNLGR